MPINKNLQPLTAFLASFQAAVIWLGFCVLAVIWVIGQLQQPGRIDSSLYGLFPPSSAMSADGEKIYAHFSQRLDAQLTWLIGGEAVAAKEAATWFEGKLRGLNDLKTIRGQVPESTLFAVGDVYLPYRYQLPSETLEQKLTNPTDYLQTLLAQIYTPFSAINGDELLRDPFLLGRNFLATQAAPGHLQWQDGWLRVKSTAAVQDKNMQWLLLRAELAISPYDLQRAPLIGEQLSFLVEELHARWPSVEVLRRGSLWFALKGSESAQQDIAVIGLGAIVGTVLLLWWAFRSGLPMVMTLLSMAIGMLVGIAAVLCIFQKIHLLTMVLGASLIGVVIDYAMHLMVEYQAHRSRQSAYEVLKHIHFPLMLSLIAAAIAYASLAFAPLPILKQMAVLAVVGLFSAYVTVCVVYPHWLKYLPARDLPRIPGAKSWLALWQNTRAMRGGFPLAIIIFSVAGLMVLSVNDDIHILQPLDQQLKRESNQQAALVGINDDLRVFLITANSAENLLQKTEQLALQLEQAMSRGELKNYRSLVSWLPSIKKQRTHYELLEKNLRPLLPTWSEQIGLQNQPVWPPFAALLPTTWLASEASVDWRSLWWQDDQQSAFATVVLLEGIVDAKKIQSLAQSDNGISWIDRKGNLSEIFKACRQQVMQWLAVAVAIVFVMLCLLYGWKSALLKLMPPCLGIAMGLSVLALCGYQLTLFSVLPCLLIFGIGMDYVLFFSSAPDQQDTSLLAVSLAAFTTLLSEGLLILSSTPAIATFGLVLSVGLLTMLLVVPVVIPSRARNFLS